MASSSTRVFRFGVFQVNLAALELRKHGVRVRVGGQPFAVLAMLLERPGEVVTREELRSRLWPSDTFVDFEQGLNSAVMKLRTALGDSPENPRYVETLPRVGYRFVAPVLDAPAGAPPDSFRPEVMGNSALEEPIETPAARGVNSIVHGLRARRWYDRFRIPLLLAAGIFLLVPIARSVFIPELNPRVIKATRLTTSSRADRWGRVQADGNRLIFLERHGARWDTMQMSLTGGEPQVLSVPFENTRVVAVSPDSSQLLLAPFVSRIDPLTLWLMPAVGGAPRRLGDIVANDAAFSPDGQRIVYSDDSGIHIVGLDGLNPRKVLTLSGEKDALGWSPDGQTIRFALEQRQHELVVSSAIWEVGVDGTNAHPLLPDWEAVPQQCCGRWTTDGRYYLFVSHSHDGSQGIWALPERRPLQLTLSPPVRLEGGPVVFDQPAPSKDGRHLFALGSNEIQEYALYEIASHQMLSLFGGSGAARWVTFSATGDWVVCVGDEAGMWRSNADGTQRRELVPANYHPHIPRINPDGSQIVFQGFERQGEKWKLYLVGTTGGVPRPITDGRTNAAAPEWSPNGKELVYVEQADGAAAPELFRLNVQSGEKVKIPGSKGMDRSFWSPDGRWLMATDKEGRRVFVFDWSAQRWTLISQVKLLGSPAWSADSQFIYVQDLLAKDQPVNRIRVADGTSTRIDTCHAVLMGNVHRCGLEGAAPDGSLLFRLSRGDHDVYSLELELP